MASTPSTYNRCRVRNVRNWKRNQVFSKLTGTNSNALARLEQAGYTQLSSWEGIVKKIECLAYVDGSLRWYWTRCAWKLSVQPVTEDYFSVDDIKMRAKTEDMVRMCPQEVNSIPSPLEFHLTCQKFTYFLENSMRESRDHHLRPGKSLMLQAVPLSSDIATKKPQPESQRKGKEKAGGHTI